MLSAFPWSIYATAWLMMWNQTCPSKWFEIWCNTYRDYNFVIAKLFLQTKESIYFSHRPNSFNQRGFLSFISIFCETSLLHNIKTYGWAFEQCTISHGTICNICRYKTRLGSDKIYRKTEMFFSCPDISSNKQNILNCLLSYPSPIIVWPCQSVSHSLCSHCETNLFMDLLHAFLKIDIWISL